MLPAITLSDLEPYRQNTMLAHLGIEFTEMGERHLSGKMPVDHRTHQPMGLLHGGASVVLAESLGSMAANLVLNMETHYAVGLEINANHLRGITEGYVFGKAEPLHVGSRTQVWQIHIRDQQDRLICTSRLTCAVMPKQ